MRPEFKEAVKIAATGEYKCIPVSLELYADQYTPLMVLRKLKNVSRHCYMLESAEDNQKWGRYTFLGYDPRLEITCTNGKLTIKNGTSVTMETKHPGEYIRQILDENKSPKIEDFPYIYRWTGRIFFLRLHEICRAVSGAGCRRQGRV